MSNNNFVKNPSQKTVLLFILIWFIGNGLIIMASTDLFSKSLELSIPIKGSVFGSTIATATLVANYFNNKKKSNASKT